MCCFDEKLYTATAMLWSFVCAALHHIRAPLVDLEVRGVPALQYFGGVIWQDEVFAKLNAGELRSLWSAACV
jgi:hypothetical protein